MRARSTFYVVQRNDSLEGVIRKNYHLRSSKEIAAKYEEVGRQNPHLKSPYDLKAGQIIYLPDDASFVQAPPAKTELDEVNRVIMSMTESERTFIVNNWATLAAIESERFTQNLKTNPAELKSALGNRVEVRSGSLSSLGTFSYRVGKSLMKTGHLGSKGKFGNLIPGTEHVWARIEGDLVRSLKSEARYLAMPSGALRLVPRNARAFSHAGSVIVVNTEGAGFQRFAKSVAKAKQYGALLKNGGKIAKVVDLGLTVSRIKEKWGTPEQDRTTFVESGKFAGGLAWGEVSMWAANSVCGALTLTTGTGGLACYAGVFLIGGIGAGYLSERVSNRLYNSGTSVLDRIRKYETLESVPWIYTGKSALIEDGI